MSRRLTDYGKVTEGSGNVTITDSHLTFTQSVPSSTWVINHSLNKYPSVTIIDSAGSEVEGGVTYVSLSQVVVTFSAGFSGKAFLN